MSSKPFLTFVLIVSFLHLYDYAVVAACLSSGNNEVVLHRGKDIRSQIKNENTTYVVKYSYDLKGQAFVLPDCCKLVFEGGTINNGEIAFNNTEVVAQNIPLFKNISSAQGTVTNDVIYVEWFNCLPSNDEMTNQTALNVLFPLAFNSGSNVYFSLNGTYKIRNHIPIIRNLDNSNIIDCKGFRISGTGPETILYNVGYYHNGKYCVEDIFNIVNCKNLMISDLSVMAKNYNYPAVFDDNGQPQNSGTNAFSLCNYVENISIVNCKAYDMPTVWYYFPKINYFYHDGGKGFSIQHSGGDEIVNKGVKNIRFENCSVENCADGFDVDMEGFAVCEGVSYENCIARNCSYGVYLVNREANRNNTTITFNRLIIEDCQIGIWGNYPIGVSVKNCYLSSNAYNKKYPEHLIENYFVQFYSAKNCSFVNNVFVKGDPVYMSSACWMGQSGSNDQYTTEDVLFENNYFSGNFSGPVIHFLNPVKTNIVRFKNITTRGNRTSGSLNGKLVEIPVTY